MWSIRSAQSWLPVNLIFHIDHGEPVVEPIILGVHISIAVEIEIPEGVVGMTACFLCLDTNNYIVLNGLLVCVLKNEIDV